jgi:hypothetical protein
VVVGRCSDGDVDFDGDVVSPSFMAQAVKAWLASYPAVRLQHRPDSPVGRGLSAWQDDSGATFVKSAVVDEAAKKLVRKQVLRAYSVGISEPQTRKSARAPRWEIHGGRLTEVSLVDSPANARCGIQVIGKSVDGEPEFVGKAWTMGKSGKPKYKAGKAGKAFKVNKAHQRLYDDPDAMAVWMGRQLRKAYRGAAVEALEFRDPRLVEMARRWLEESGGQG